MKQRRLPNGKYRINYFDRLFPLYLMLLTAGLSWGLQTGNKLKVQARVGETLVTVDQPVKVQVSPTPTPQLAVMPTPVIPTATPTPTQKEAIIAEIVRVFGEEAPNAFNVLFCENRGLRPDAINHNRNGSTDHSIFQINSIHTKRFGDKFKTDWKENIRVAYVLQQEQGWRIWSCSDRVQITPFWKE